MRKTTELAIRRNKGRALLPQFMSELEAALGRPVEVSELVSLEETDEVFERFRVVRDRAKADRAALISRAKVGTPEELHEAIDLWRKQVPSTEVYLFRLRSDMCGAIRLSSDEVIRRITHLMTLDCEDVLACSKDGRYGVSCEWTSPTWNRTERNLYELFCWAYKEGDQLIRTPAGDGFGAG